MPAGRNRPFDADRRPSRRLIASPSCRRRWPHRLSCRQRVHQYVLAATNHRIVGLGRTICRQQTMKNLALCGLIGTAILSVPAIGPDRRSAQDLAVVPPAHRWFLDQDWAADIEKERAVPFKRRCRPSSSAGVRPLRHGARRHRRRDLGQSRLPARPSFPTRVGQLPFTFADPARHRRGPMPGTATMAGAEMKDTHFCLAFIHYRRCIPARQEGLLPDDLKGLKIAPAQSTIGQLVTMLAAPTSASRPNRATCWERGVADAITFPGVDLPLARQGVKYHIEAPLYTTDITYSTT